MGIAARDSPVDGISLGLGLFCPFPLYRRWQLSLIPHDRDRDREVDDVSL